MKLAKALKLKNKLAGDITWLRQLLGSQNCRPTKWPFDYDNHQVLADLHRKIDELVKIKSAIGTANATVYSKVFRLAELKGLIVTLKGLDTREGRFTEINYNTPVEVEYRSQLKKAEADKIVAEIEAEIVALQDALDEFNNSTSIEV